MSSQTPTIDLKKPEGSDPFLTSDFADNYDKIDAAVAELRSTTGSGTPLTQTAADARYVRTVNGTGPDGSGNVVVAGGSGGGGTPPDDAVIIKGPGRTNTKVVYGVFGWALNAANGVNGLTVNFPGIYTVAPAVIATPRVGSNFDLLLNTQGLTATGASFRLAQKSGTAITGSGAVSWMAIGQA